MDLQTLLEYAKQYGPVVFIVIIFLVRDWLREQMTNKREDSLLDRFNKLEAEFRDKMLPVIDRATTAISQNSMMLTNLETRLAWKTAALQHFERVAKES
jgi:hypothetical protein